MVGKVRDEANPAIYGLPGFQVVQSCFHLSASTPQGLVECRSQWLRAGRTWALTLLPRFVFMQRAAVSSQREVDPNRNWDRGCPDSVDPFPPERLHELRFTGILAGIQRVDVRILHDGGKA